MCWGGQRQFLRHPWKTFPHVSDDVHNHTTMLLHPRRVHCVWTEQQTITLSACTNTHWTSVTSLHLTSLAAVEGSCQVGVNHSFPAFSGHVLYWAAELPSTVVHQVVYPTILLQHRWHKGLYLPHGESKQDTTVKSGDQTSSFRGWK